VVEPPTPLKNDGVKVSWDDELPNMMEKIKAIFQTTTQYVCMYVYIYILCLMHFNAIYTMPLNVYHYCFLAMFGWRCLDDP
jgi:hypothetical protein